MSTTVTYKGNTITTATNQTKTLTTAGKWLDANIVITDSSSSSSGGYVTQDQDGYIVLPSTGNGGGSGTTPNLQAKTNITPTASSQTITADSGYDGLSSVQINAIPSNYVIPTGNKSIVANGTGIDVANYATVSVSVPTSGSSAAQHTIYLEFSDSTNTSIPVYYDDSFISTVITGSKPTAYNLKEITLAQLDNVTWYEPTQIPLNTELVDYTKCTQGYVIDENGDLSANQWSYVTDYTPVASGMTFEYTAYYWFYIGLYDESKNFLRSIYVMNDATVDPNDSNTGNGTLSGNKLPATVAYARLCGTAPLSGNISLIRTA